MVTIKDIAKIAGVSHTSVSRALNDHPSMKKETKQKIVKIAKDLGYVANMNARSLYTRKSYTIGLFFSTLEPYTSMGFLADVLQGVQAEVPRDYILSVQEINHFELNENYIKQRFDGIVVMSQTDRDDEFIYAVKRAGVPIVVVNRYFDNDETINILARDSQSVKEAIDYAYRLGHTSIGVIEGPAKFRSTTERKAGLLESLNEHHITLKPEHIAAGDYSIKSGREAMETILSASDTYPSFIFAFNDDMAIGAISTCHKHKIRVPEDISFIGFDDMSFSAYINPPLTTIHRPVKEIASTGARELMNLINHPETEKKRIYVDTEFVVRESIQALEQPR